MKQTDLFDGPPPSGPANRREEMERNYLEFDANNPVVWDLFKRFTTDAINVGLEAYSADAVMHRVRWETDVGRSEPYSKEGNFKINNNHVCFYARRFMREHPQHDGFFRIRVQISATRRPNGRPPDHPLEG